MEQAQDYSFNKAHAACYALIAYRTAWLKANHPREYMAALISSVMNTKDRVPFYVNACHEMGIEVLPPDVNFSQCDFAVVEGKIRFGLNAVKNVGDTAARAIVAAREHGRAVRVDLGLHRARRPAVANKRALESLVKCGALDSTGRARARGCSTCLEPALAWGSRQQADRLAGQGSIFDLGFEAAETSPSTTRTIPRDEFDKNELLALEKETLGLYVSEHPLSAIRDQLRRKTDCTLVELERRRDGEVVTVGGIVAAVKQLTTKKGEPMVFLRLDDVDRRRRVRRLQLGLRGRARAAASTDRVLVVKGRVDHKEGETKLIALEVSAFEAMPERKDVRLKHRRAAGARGRDPRARAAREGVPRRGAGADRRWQTSQGPRTLALGPDYRVEPAADFFAEVKALLGPAAVA